MIIGRNAENTSNFNNEWAPYYNGATSGANQVMACVSR